MKFLRQPRLLLLPLFLCCALISFAQEKTVTGKVTDKSDNSPLQGVTIKVKNGTQSTMTDESGMFSIKVPSELSILTFTYVGYGIYETKAGTGALNVSLENLTSDLEEAVVVGYGVQKKAHLTGAVETIRAKEIQDLPVSNLGAALSGRILGVSISGGTSRPNSTASITIRNPVTLAKDGGNLNPLVVIDGVIQTTSQGLNDMTYFNQLDPSEVESITFLKDGAAAVYGSRGGNGAILVTTKRGSSGKPRISYNGGFATNNESYRTKTMSAVQLAQYINITNGPNGANANPTDKTRFFSPDEIAAFQNTNYDWLEEAWHASTNTHHSLNVSGGSDKASYFANVSYYTQDGNLGELKFNKWTYRAGTDASVAAGLKLGLQVAGNYTDSKEVNSKIGGENSENDYRNLMRTPKYTPIYVGTRPVRPPGGSGSSNLSSYHFFELNRLQNYMNKENTASQANVYLEYEPPFLKGLKARVSYSRQNTEGHDSRIGSNYMLYRFVQTGTNGHIIAPDAAVRDSALYKNDNSVRFFNNRSKSEQENFTLTYMKTFGKHTISALASVEKSETESTQEDESKEAPSQFTNGQFNTAFGAIDGRTFAYESGTLGYIGRVNYNYDGRYLAEFLFRSDASTKFAPENYWGKFYSLSGGWIISSEKFFHSKAVDFLKLRYSVGLLGNDDTRAWQWRQRFTFQNGQGGQFGADNNPAGTGVKMEVSPNRDATWSDVLKQNLGVDGRFLGNRLSTTLELFYTHSTNMLLERTANVPVTVGGSIASQNYGSINFFGTELGLGWEDHVGKDFTYGASLRLSWSDNKVVKGNFNTAQLLLPWNSKPGESSDNGKWGYNVLGMFRTQDEVTEYVTKNHITSVFGTTAANLRPGSLYYEDVRGPIKADGTFAGPDGIIDNNDQIRLSKKAGSHYSLGSTIHVGWKGLNFEAVIVGTFGGWSEIDARDRLETNIDNLYQNGPEYWGYIYDPVLNPSGKYPNPYFSAINTDPTSTFWQNSPTRLRIRNASLSYAIPRSLLDKAKISGARIVLTTLNPLNLYNPFSYKDSDGSWDVYPALRTFSAGLSLTL